MRQQLTFVFLIIIIMMVSRAWSAVVSLDPKVGENIRMGDDPEELPLDRRAQAEPHIARSWTDPNLIVATFQEGRFESGGAAVGNGYAASADGGLTWRREPLRDVSMGFGDGPFERATDPVVGFDLDNRIFLNSLAYNLSETAPPSKLFVSRSEDGGQTFEPPFTAYTDSWPLDAADKNWMAIDTWPNSPHVGRIAVTFSLFGYDAVQNISTNHDMLNTYSDDGGESWSEAVSLNLTNGFGAQPLFLPDGTLAVLYWQHLSAFLTPRPNDRLEVMLSSDGGATFGDPFIVASGINPHSDPHARDGVGLISATTDRLRGVLYVAYQARATREDEVTPSIMFTRSTDGGHTWTSPIPVNDSPLGASVFNAAIAVSPDGQHVTISFYDTRHGSSPYHVDLYLAESFDGGESWEPNLRLSSETSDMRLAPLTARGYMLGDYQGITPSLNFEAPAVAVWIDTRTGSPDPFGVRIHRTQGTAFETWRKLRYSAEELTNPVISAENADEDEDGVADLFEYLHATEPDSPTPDPLIISRVGDQPEKVTVTYDRLAVVRDLDIWWIGSTNLVDWMEIAPDSEQVHSAENPVMERVETRFTMNRHPLFLRLAAKVKLMIYRPPQAQVVRIGDDVALGVKAVGTGFLHYQWFKDGEAVSGATNVSLIINSVAGPDTGSYSVQVQDDYGSLLSEPALLTVLVPPTIIEHPQDITVTEGGMATFSVSVTNTTTLPITYTWRKGFSVVETQVLNEFHSIFTITNVVSLDAGQYRVSVSNPAVSAGPVSNGATLTVLEAGP